MFWSILGRRRGFVLFDLEGIAVVLVVTVTAAELM
jgi:hypothetical protein